MSLVGIDNNWKRDIINGIGLGGFMITLNVIGLFSLALPPTANLFATNVGRLLIVLLIAPILEEALFRGIVLTDVLKGLKFWQSNVLQSLAFASFHLFVYSGVLLEAFDFSAVLIVGGAFVSAFIFGMIMGTATRRWKSLLPSILAHSIINFWLVQGVLVFI